ncbi:MAG: L-serine ammonia-lyase, iron-sulfur-dependent, subunit alpha [Deltaproteobacteria bacterium]
MTVAPYPEFFNDVFGPVMQPGSSSHTAGPCRLGYLAGCLLGQPVAKMRIELDNDGSFAGTFGIMAEDRAMVAGVLGYLPDDARLFRSFELAEEAGVAVEFAFTTIADSKHPNAVRFVLTGEDGLMVTLVGDSTGGGMVETVTVDGFPYRTLGDAFVLFVQDPQEALSSESYERLRADLFDVLDEQRVRVEGRGVLNAFALPAEPDLAALRRALGDDVPVLRLALLRPVLPVVSRPDRRPQLFDTMTRWRELAADREVPLWEVAVHYEMDASGWTRRQVLDRMRELSLVMRRQTRAVYDEDVVAPDTEFKPDFAGRWMRHAGTPARVSDGITAQTIENAYGAGAGIPGVENVPGPMGGGAGYIFAALSAVQEARGLDADDLLRGLFVAAGIGAIAYTRTEPTGEVLGCTGESGVCGAMAAAAIAEMVGGSPEAVESAASLALQAFMGLPCDPMPGGLSQPCRSRIMAATCTAHVFADLALAGHEAVLPLHEAIDVADRIGRALPPELLCTSEGGCCLAPAAQARRAAYRRWFDESRPEDRPPGNLI